MPILIRILYRYPSKAPREYPEIDQNKTETPTTPGFGPLDHGKDESAVAAGVEKIHAPFKGFWCFIM